MATLADLARSHTDLDEAEVAHLQDLVSIWGLLADLSFADLLLYGRRRGDPVAPLVLLGHVRPTTGTTLYRADLVGRSFESRRRPLVAEAFSSGSTTSGTVNVGADRDVNLLAVPVRRLDTTLAVLARERIRPVDRPTSEQERTYLTVFDRFARMLEAGEFPYREEERLRHRTPRVGDGLLLVDSNGRIEFASPNAVSLLHRLGMTRGVTGARFDDTGLGSSMLRAAFARRSAVIDEMERQDEVAVVSHCFPLLESGLATGAIVLVRADRARDFPKPPVYVLGSAAQSAHRQISQMKDFTVTAARESGKRAFAAAGVSPGDIQAVELYDAFTINTILFLEDLGFCAKGEGGAFVEGGRIAPDGVLPVNTNGGGLSCVHPGMYGIFTVIEAARQIRGDAPGIQLNDIDVALAHGNGGVLSSQVTAILGSQATL